MKFMNKRVIVSLPESLYESMKRLASREYRSVSSLIRESVLEKVEDELTTEEWAILEQGFRDIDAGRGVNWREVKK